jgi:hypothetical protein
MKAKFLPSSEFFTSGNLGKRVDPVGFEICNVDVS